MFYDASKNDHGLPHNPMKALIGPRPIGWISAMNAKGEVNLSPYSFFNAVAEGPFLVAFASNGYKDAVAFIDETREFVCNLATWDLRGEMNKTSAPLARGQSEFAHAGLEMAPSRMVKPPRVAASPAALECRHVQTIRLETMEGEALDQYLVMGQVIGVHIDDAFIKDGAVDTAAMRPIMRGGYMEYFVATPETKFAIQRPTRA